MHFDQFRPDVDQYFSQLMTTLLRFGPEAASVEDLFRLNVGRRPHQREGDTHNNFKSMPTATIDGAPASRRCSTAPATLATSPATTKHLDDDDAQLLAGGLRRGGLATTLTPSGRHTQPLWQQRGLIHFDSSSEAGRVETNALAEPALYTE